MDLAASHSPDLISRRQIHQLHPCQSDDGGNCSMRSARQRDSSIEPPLPGLPDLLPSLPVHSCLSALDSRYAANNPWAASAGLTAAAAPTETDPVSSTTTPVANRLPFSGC